jgi:hypothetical protein
MSCHFLGNANPVCERETFAGSSNLNLFPYEEAFNSFENIRSVTRKG